MYDHLRYDGWLGPLDASAPLGAPDGAQARCAWYPRPRGRGRDFLFFLFGLLVWKARVEKHKYILIWRPFVFLGVEEEARGERGSGMKARPRCGATAAVRLPGCRGGDKRRRRGRPGWRPGRGAGLRRATRSQPSSEEEARGEGDGGQDGGGAAASRRAARPQGEGSIHGREAEHTQERRSTARALVESHGGRARNI